MAKLSCRVCNGSQFSLTELGYYVCRLCATQLEEINELEISEFDAALQTNKTVKYHKEAKSRIKRLRPSPIKHSDLLEAFQFILQLQISVLINDHSFPPSYGTAVFDLWFSFLERTASGSVSSAANFPITVTNTVSFLLTASVWLKLPYTPLFFLELAASGSLPLYHSRKLLPSRLRLSADHSYFAVHSSLNEGLIWHSSLTLCQVLSLHLPSCNSSLSCYLLHHQLSLPPLFLRLLLRLSRIVVPVKESCSLGILPTSFNLFSSSLVIVLVKLLYGHSFPSTNQKPFVHDIGYLELPGFSEILSIFKSFLVKSNVSLFSDCDFSMSTNLLYQSYHSQIETFDSFKSGFFGQSSSFSSSSVFSKWIDYFNTLKFNNSHYCWSRTIPDPTPDSSSTVRGQSSVDISPSNPSDCYVRYKNQLNTIEHPSIFLIMMSLCKVLNLNISELRYRVSSTEKALLQWSVGVRKSLGYSVNTRKDLLDYLFEDLV
ncbi:hypothetical protein GEMRC1_002054 [Eukaryota sp. GEM-RC1]